jgi:hypothetical protein
VSWIGRRRQTEHLTVRNGDQKPVARAEDLVIEELGEELLVYDQTNDTAHSLSVAATRVWRACDGETSEKALSAKLDLDADTVTRALEELDECNLLDNGEPISGMTRREATLKTAKLGVGVASAPLIYSILAPAPALAVTQQYCLRGSPCSEGGCGVCMQIKCACCGTGGGNDKICTADCSGTNCTKALITSICGTEIPPADITQCA